MQQEKRKQEQPKEEYSMDYTSWEEIDRWAVDPGRVPEPAWDSMEQCAEGYRRMRLAKQARRRGRKPGNQPKNVLGGGLTGSMATSGRRPAQTPCAYRGARETGQAPCYAVVRTVSPVQARCGIFQLRVSAGLD